MNTAKKSSMFQKLIVPGIVFQSVVIAGGYGTGAELVQYFGPSGTVGGLLSMTLISMVTWAIVCAITFEFARTFKTFDYKSMMKKVMGPGWIAYEACYLILLMIVLAVVTASAGDILNELFGLNKWIGIFGMGAAVFLLVMNGSALIEKVLSYWSFLLYGVYILFLVMMFMNFGTEITTNISTGTTEGNWVVLGFQYAFYNLGIIPAVLYTVRHCESRKEALTSGVIAGVIAILPAIFLFTAMTAFYPAINSEGLPVNYMLSQLGTPWLQYLFQFVLFGTLIETGAGFIFAVTDRIDTAIKAKGQETPKWVTPVAALTLIGVGIVVSQFGLLNLILTGYGAASYGFFFFYVLPICTIGLYKIIKAKGEVQE